MTLRLNAAQLLPFLLITGGCWLSHELGPSRPVGPPLPVRDGGTPVIVRDASIAPVDSGPSVPDAGGACDVSSTHLEITSSCAASHLDDIQLLGVSPEPASHGIRLHANFCPGDAAECPCDIVLTNVGTDLAGEIAPEDHLGLDLATGWAPFLALTHRPTCECDGCPCSLSFLFYATDADPDRARGVPSDMVFSTGPVVCPAPSACETGTWALSAQNTAVGASTVIGEGTTTNVGGISVRNVRDASIFAPCAACATCGERSAGWVAWLPAFRGG